MTVLLRELTGAPHLGVSLLTDGGADAALTWAGSSDLDDPTPFVEPGQLLLTTGRQFDGFALGDYIAYVERLVRAGVAALGFGTEVVRAGTPADLIEACSRQGLPLVEVPYATPFLALAKDIAERLAADTRERLERVLAAQDSISRAVLSAGGLAAAVSTASTALGCRLAVLDPDGELLEGGASPAARQRGVDLLRRGMRARDSGGDEESAWVAQTLGRSGRLLGAVVAHRSGGFAAEEIPILTLLTALTELSLEHSDDRRLAFRALGPELLRLLLDGRVDPVRAALVHHPATLPEEPFQVVALAADQVEPRVRESLERMAEGRRNRLFLAQHGAEILVLADDSSWPAVRALLRQAAMRGGTVVCREWTAFARARAEA